MEKASSSDKGTGKGKEKLQFDEYEDSESAWADFTDRTYATVDHSLFPEISGSHNISRLDQITITKLKYYSSVTLFICFDFSPDGMLLACAGGDNKAVLFSTDELEPKHFMEHQEQNVKDIRFSRISNFIATGCIDKTIKIYRVETPHMPFRTLQSMWDVCSLDFHPRDADVICSSDTSGNIFIWSIHHGTLTNIFKGRAQKVRYQPCQGKYLAAVYDRGLSIFDADTRGLLFSFEDHEDAILSICWDGSGDFLATLCKYSVRLWSFKDGSIADSIGECKSSESNFTSCVFHPVYSSVVIIAAYEALLFWDVEGNKRMGVYTRGVETDLLAVSEKLQLLASISTRDLSRKINLWRIDSGTRVESNELVWFTMPEE